MTVSPRIFILSEGNRKPGGAQAARDRPPKAINRRGFLHRRLTHFIIEGGDEPMPPASLPQELNSWPVSPAPFSQAAASAWRHPPQTDWSLPPACRRRKSHT